jgi:hypothetical protein
MPNPEYIAKTVDSKLLLNRWLDRNYKLVYRLVITTIY